MNENEKILARIAVSKSICKEYNNSNYERTVYLQNGDEFQIQLFNPYTYVICCHISIDNKYIGNDIVLRPGERLWLERYIDVPNKFKFSTYTVEEGSDTKLVREAISKNGLIEIKFYKEKEKKPVYNPIYINASPIYYYNDNINHLNDVVYCDGSSANNATFTAQTFGFAPDVTTELSASNYCNTSCSAVDANFSLNLELSSAKPISCEAKATQDSYKNQARSIKKEKTIETGRVEKGGYSTQKFVDVDYDFESWPFKTEKLHILPLSQKKVNKNDLEKIYCPECGRKLKPKYKFCPYCGAEIE